MPKFKVEFRAYVFATDTVEAEDESEAAEKAFGNGFPDICAQCSGWGKDYTVAFPDDPASWEVLDTTAADR